MTTEVPDINHPTHLDGIHARFDRLEAIVNAAPEKIIAALNATGIATATARTQPTLPYAGRGATLPNYGRAKGQPIAGASLDDLRYYASGCKRSLDDPGKARWHDNERATLAAIEAEIARQSGATPTDSAPIADDDLPF